MGRRGRKGGGREGGGLMYVGGEGGRKESDQLYLSIMCVPPPPHRLPWATCSTMADWI